MSLDNIRKEIDAIDKELIDLLLKRLDCSIKVAEIKTAEGIPVLDSAREEAVLNKVREAGGNYGNYVAGVWRAIMDTSKELQHDSMGTVSPLAVEILSAKRVIPADFDGKIACQGASGAFSAQAAEALFPKGKRIFASCFRDVFEAVENGTAEYGILPVENSNTGSVAEVYDLLLEYRHYIAGGIELKIEQNLLTLPGADIGKIKEVYSHPQGLAQCAEYIKAHGMTPMEASNTAVAARSVAQNGNANAAAIGSASAAKEYGLQVAAAGIQSGSRNTTRFIAISKNMIIRDDSNKISLIFSIPHVTGSLYRVLTRFATHGLNLTKIESRVAPEGDFNYLFYLDFTGSVGDLATVKLICDMEQELPDFAFLGNYKEIVQE